MCQSSPAQQAPPVRPVPYDRSDRSHQRLAHFTPLRLEYRVKERKQEVQTTADLEKPKSATSPTQDHVAANDHEASSSKVADKYHQPRWCPEGLTHTQKRKLQHLRNKEKREQEVEKMRDEHFNKYRLMIPQGKVWQAKTVD